MRSKCDSIVKRLPRCQGDAFHLVSFANRKTSIVTLSGVRDFFSETFVDALRIAEGSLTGPIGHKPEGNIDPSERRYVDRYWVDDATVSYSGYILCWSSILHRLS